MQTRIHRRTGFSTVPPLIGLGGERAGNTIIEALVAVSLVVVGIVGIVQLVSRSIRANELVADRFTATHLAAEGVEIIRNRLEGYLAASSTAGGIMWDELSVVLESGNYEVAAGSPLYMQRIAGTSTTPLRFSSEILPYYGYNVAGSPTRFFRTVVVLWSDPCLPPNAASISMSIQSIVTWTTRDETSSLVVADELQSWRGNPVCRQ